jgi:hypothetical protein
MNNFVSDVEAIKDFSDAQVFVERSRRRDFSNLYIRPRTGTVRALQPTIVRNLNLTLANTANRRLQFIGNEVIPAYQRVLMLLAQFDRLYE